MKTTLEIKPAQIQFTDCLLKFKVSLFISLVTKQTTWVILN